MIGLIQLVSHAQVEIDNKMVAAIQSGILALIGMEKTDTERQAQKLFEKILNFRIFSDTEGKMNLSLVDREGGLLLVPQFTLVAETTKGTRPGFSRGMPPDQGKALFEFLVNHASKNYKHTACGQFGASMQVTLCNDGPATFILDVK